MINFIKYFLKIIWLIYIISKKQLLIYPGQYKLPTSVKCIGYMFCTIFYFKFDFCVVSNWYLLEWTPKYFSAGEHHDDYRNESKILMRSSSAVHGEWRTWIFTTTALRELDTRQPTNSGWNTQTSNQTWRRQLRCLDFQIITQKNNPFYYKIQL